MGNLSSKPLDKVMVMGIVMLIGSVIIVLGFSLFLFTHLVLKINKRT